MNAENQEAGRGIPFSSEGHLTELAPELWSLGKEAAVPASHRVAGGIKLGSVEQISSGIKPRYTPEPAA
jgi:hypothetical protein